MWRHRGVVFPQFTALYPEMVDALILLDNFVLLPTDTVLTIVLYPGFDREDKSEFSTVVVPFPYSAVFLIVIPDSIICFAQE